MIRTGWSRLVDSALATLSRRRTAGRRLRRRPPSWQPFQAVAAETLEVRQLLSGSMTNTTPTATFTAAEGNSTGNIILATFQVTDANAQQSDFTVTAMTPANWGGTTVGTPATPTVQFVSRTGSVSNWKVVGSAIYAEPGTEHITLTVTDNILAHSGSITTTGTQTTVNVSDAALANTTPVSTRLATEGIAISPTVINLYPSGTTNGIVLATFTDKNPYETGADLSAVVTFGGTTQGTPNVSIVKVGQTATFSSFDVIADSITYARKGTYTVSVTVKDEGVTKFTTTNSKFSVADAPLLDSGLSGNISSETEGIANAANITLAKFHDNDLFSNTTYFTPTVNWGGTLIGTPTVVVQTDVGAGNYKVVVLAGTLTYKEEGTYAFTVKVKDVDGSTVQMAGRSFVVADAPLTVGASLGSVNVVEGHSTGSVIIATFTDDDSSAPVTDFTATVNWGGTLIGTPTVSVQLVDRLLGVSHWKVVGSATYAETGSYTPSVTVTDIGGATPILSTQKTFNVTAGALLSTTGNTTVNAKEGNSTGTIVLAKFTDANPYETGADLSATVNWGAGAFYGNPNATVQIQLVSRSSSVSTWQVVGSVAYKEPGLNTITVTVNDADGASVTTAGSNRTKVNVTDALITNTTLVTNPTAFEGNSTGTIVLATFTDNNPLEDNLGPDLTATVNWGGTTTASTFSIVSNGASTSTQSFWKVIGSATYTDTGSHTVSVTVKDETVTQFTTTNTHVIVSDAVLTDTSVANPLVATEGNTTGVVTLATFDDGNPAATVADFGTPTINWGGSVISSTAAVVVANGVSPGVSHWLVQASAIYAEKGTYSVTVSVHDVDGSSVQSSQTSFTVADAALTDTTPVGPTIIPAVEGNSTGNQLLATFDDGDPSATLSDFSVNVNWGGTLQSGTIATAWIVANGVGGGASHWQVYGTATYAEYNATPYTVTVTVNDVDGAAPMVSTGKTKFAVADATLADTTPGDNYNAFEGNSTGTMVLATFTDGNPFATLSDFTATVDFGTLPTAFTNFNSSGATVTFTTTSGVSSDVTLTFTASDRSGAGPGIIVLGNAITIDLDTDAANLGLNATTANGLIAAITADLSASALITSALTAGPGTTDIATPTFSAQPINLSLPSLTQSSTYSIQLLSRSSSLSTWQVVGSATYKEIGNYEVDVVVTDADGNSIDTSVGSPTTVTVDDAVLTDTSPTSSSNAIEGNDTGTVVLATFTDANPFATVDDFAGTTVTDWGGTIDIGSDSWSVEFVTSTATASYWRVVGNATYTEKGNYTVTVEIDDADGNSFTTANTTIHVADAALSDTTPIASQSATEGIAITTVVLATFTDGNSLEDGTDLSATVDWGGTLTGTLPTVTVVDDGGGNFHVEADTVTYLDAGNYTVKVRVNDVDGSTFTTINTTISVDDALLTDTTTPATVIPAVEGNSTGSQILATFTDANPFSTLSDFTATVNWGGTVIGTPSVSIVQPGGVGTTYQVLGSATYAEKGSYTVTVTVNDDDGSSVSTTNTSFAVADAPLTDTSATVNYSAVEGNSTGNIILATFSDANPYAPVSDFSASVDWDGALAVGTTPTVSVVLVSRTLTTSNWKVVGNATYAEKGTNNVSVTVNDVDGLSTGAMTETTIGVADAVLTDTTSAATYSAIEGNDTGDVVLATFKDGNPFADVSDFSTTSVNWGGTTVGSPTVLVQFVSSTATSSTWEVVGNAKYADAGTYNVTVTVNDVDLSSVVSSNKVTFSVADAALTDATDINAFSAVEGNSIGTSIVIATFTDNNPSASGGDFSANVTWGGALVTGNIPTVSVVFVSSSGSDSTWNVVATGTKYAEAGNYTVTVTVNDNDGSSVTTSNTTFSVDDALLTDTTTANPLNAVEGNSTGSVVLATFTDNNEFATPSDFATSTVDFGGTVTTSTFSVQLVSSGAGISTWNVVGNATYAEAGTYDVTVTVNDVDGSTITSTGFTTVSVSDATLTDTTPTTSHNAFEGNSTGDIVLATFSDANPLASVSDFTATVTNWGGPIITGSDSVSVEFVSSTLTASNWRVVGHVTYSDEGSFTVSVTVDDVESSSVASTGKTTINVADAALTDTTPVATAPGTWYEGNAVTNVVLATFTDANPYEDGTELSATVTNWGGTIDAGSDSVAVQFVSSGGGISTWQVVGSVTYLEKGDYAVTVHVTDASGNSFTTSNTTISVDDAALNDTTVSTTITATEGIATAPVGGVVLATFTDSNPLESGSDFLPPVIDWGGGTLVGTLPTVTVQLVSSTPTSTTWKVVADTVTFAEKGSYTITVEVDDVDGNIVTTSNTQFDVSDAVLTDTTTPNVINATAGNPTGSVVLATFTDANSFEDGTELSALVDWGGTVTAATFAVQSDGFGGWQVVGDVTYATAGAYLVTVQVDDNDGSTFTTASTSFNVT